MGRAGTRSGGSREQTREITASEHEAPRRRGDGSMEHLAHLDHLAGLRQSLELQGATVVLIVFAVVLLGFNGFLGGPEVATILAGITGYVLGTRSQTAQALTPPQPPASTPPSANQGDGGGTRRSELGA
ncbi:MAG: hypothetical protein M3256_04530 [Actinomycetota bacterium]|nr:hypothetical protein [Actinomycetota bacterium]